MNKFAQYVFVGLGGLAMIGVAVYLGRNAGPGFPSPESGLASQSDTAPPAAEPETPEQRLETLRTQAQSNSIYFFWQQYINELIAQEKFDEAMAACDEMAAIPQLEYEALAMRATVHAQTGEADAAFDLLDRAFVSGEAAASPQLLLTNPQLNPIRTDPRFEPLVEAARAHIQEIYERADQVQEDIRQQETEENK